MKDIMAVASCGMTDKGLVRENNEDFYMIDEDNGVYTVADGLGGEEAGEVASRLAAETIGAYFCNLYKKQAETVTGDMIDEAVKRAHRTIQDASRKNTPISGMGATVVFAVKQPSYFWVANVGDSRGYLARDGLIELVTKDHSLVARLAEEGKIKPNEVRTHYLRSIVTRSLGVGAEGGCYKRRLDIQQGDILILCSDGLWEMLADEEIKTIVFESGDVEGICKKLVEAANLAGGDDNITVVAVAVGRRALQSRREKARFS